MRRDHCKQDVSARALRPYCQRQKLVSALLCAIPTQAGPLSPTPRMAASLSAMASPPQGLSALIQMDMSGLDLMLKSLTSAFDAKLENVMGQLTELQRTSAEQQKNHQVQMEDVLSRLAGTVSQGDLDAIKGDLDGFKGIDNEAQGALQQRARRHSKELDELRSHEPITVTSLASLAREVAKLEEKKCDRDQFQRLVNRESVERLGHVEAAINQQRVMQLEQRVEQMHVDAHKARVALNQMRQAISGPMGKVQLGSALKSGAVSMPRVQPNAEAASHHASLVALCPHLALSLSLGPRPEPQRRLAGGSLRDAARVAALRDCAAAGAP